MNFSCGITKGPPVGSGPPVASRKGPPVGSGKGSPVPSRKEPPVGRGSGPPAGSGNGPPAGSRNGPPVGRDNGPPVGRGSGPPMPSRNGPPVDRDNGPPVGRDNGPPVRSGNESPVGSGNGPPVRSGNESPVGSGNGPPDGHGNRTSRESSVGPAGSDTSESSVGSTDQRTPRKIFRIRSKAGEMTFGKLFTSPCFVNPEQAGYVGFANLPNQVHRKSVKKGFEFTLMVVGESGLGKSTLVNSLFLTDLYPERHIPSAAEKIKQTVKIDASTVEIEERGVKLRLTVVDTPGFGDSLNSTECFRPIIQYIDDQFERYLNDESGLNRRHIIDNRVHCCFYFINPSGHGLKPLDIAFMKAVHHKVNIVPVVAKADTLTQLEVTALKRKILDQIDEVGVRIYPLPDCDSDEDEDYKEQCKQLKNAVPFTVIGANTIIEVKGRKVRGRMYPWGVVEVENPDHCDFIKLRTMLITHMQDLQEVTQETHYENFRAEKMASGSTVKTGKPPAAGGRIENGGGNFSDKERELRQKEEELRRMQEQLARMQAEIDSTKPQLIQNGN